MNFATTNPTTEEVVEEFAFTPRTGVETAIIDADRAYQDFRRTTLAQRGSWFRKAAAFLRRNSNELGRLMALEMGKPLAQGVAEANKCAWVCEYFADNAAEFLKGEKVDIEGNTGHIRYESLGPILAIMPWNFPLWQLFRCAAPIMMAGNTMILKHAPNVPQCAHAIATVFSDAGFPANAFVNVFANLEDTRLIIDSPFVQGVTLTGSTRAGRAVAAQAGAALKKSVLELGGADPVLVFADCEFDATIETIVNSRILNSGQSCIAAKRFLVEKSIFKSVQEAIIARLEATKVSDPIEEGCGCGPLARGDLRDEVARQVNESLKKGASAAFTAKAPAKGYFYPPTVLANVQSGMPAWDEEIFGPVFSMVPFSSAEEALTLANDTAYGLGAAIFSSDLARSAELANEIEAGQVFINEMVKSDPRLPFGGIKESGYGRELGAHGMHEFVNTKTIYISK